MEPGFFDGALADFLTVTARAYGRLLPYAAAILFALVVLELVFLGLRTAMGSTESPLNGFIWLSLKVGIWGFLIASAPPLLSAILDSFIQIGLIGGGNLFTVADLLNPTQIVALGFVAAQPLFDHIASYGALNVLGNLPDIIITGLSGFLVVLCFGAGALQMIVSLVEFGIFAALTVIALPFGVNSKLEFIASGPIQGVFRHAFKVGVLAFVLSIAVPVLQRVAPTPSPSWTESLVLGLVAIMFALLIWRVPSIASGIMSGQPSLGVGAFVGMAGAVTVGALAAGAAGSGAARGIASGTASVASMVSGGSGSAGGGGGSSGGMGVASQGGTRHTSAISTTATLTRVIPPDGNTAA